MESLNKACPKQLGNLHCQLPYILESNPQTFYSFRGLKKSDAD